MDMYSCFPPFLLRFGVLLPFCYHNSAMTVMMIPFRALLLLLQMLYVLCVYNKREKHNRITVNPWFIHSEQLHFVAFNSRLPDFKLLSIVANSAPPPHPQLFHLFCA
jgi:hypothetical protein